MRPLGHLGHLARRFLGMLSPAAVPTDDRQWALERLSEPEAALWDRLSAADQRHGIEVARRFVELAPTAESPAIAAALLHDIGKLDSNLGVTMRVVATIVGPRTARLRRYHDHERIGATMLREIGSDERTVALVGCTSDDAEMSAALHTADDV